MIPDISQMTNINDTRVIYPSWEVSARVWPSCPLSSVVVPRCVSTPPADTVGKSRALYLSSVLAGKSCNQPITEQRIWILLKTWEAHPAKKKKVLNIPWLLPTLYMHRQSEETEGIYLSYLKAENSLEFFSTEKVDRLTLFTERKHFWKLLFQFCFIQIEQINILHHDKEIFVFHTNRDAHETIAKQSKWRVVLP